MKNNKKMSEGITLIALVVTIIILLILAGISIGMLSGDNGILGQAGNAKTQTDIAGEKEIIDLAVVHAMGKSKYGDIDETYFTSELEKNNATVIKSGSKYKVTFPSTRQYEVDSDGNVKEKKVNPNALEISELYDNASTYFGWDVINYAETLPTELQDTKWQLFYAGALDGETEERIYLISKEYVKNTVLPAKDGAKPIPIDGSDYKAKFSTYNRNEAKINDGVCNPSIYKGSEDVTLEMQKYNKDYFKDYTSTSSNMRAVAYMLDTDIWSTFATSSENYAEWAIGGPTIELLFKAYNKYKNAGENSVLARKADAVSTKGYQISVNGGQRYTDHTSGVIENDVTTETNQIDSPYSVYNLSSIAHGYWIASPSNYYSHYVMQVEYTGYMNSVGSYGDSSAGFRPLVLLDSNFTLEKTKDSNGNDAFKIVEK